jgi:hypothetical protein
MVIAERPEVPSRDRVTCRRNLKTALALVAGIALLSGCREWDNGYDPIGNHPPAVPKYPRPLDSGLVMNAGLVLSWHSYDPDSGDTAYFDIFMGTASPPGLVRAGWADTTFQPTSVACATEYYWRVIAYDNHGDSAVGPVWQFTTADSISVTVPDTGERLRIGSQDTIAWIGGLPAVDSTVLYRSNDDGASWTRLGSTASPGQFIWQVFGPATESARVKVVACSSTDTMTGTSSRFAIEETLSLSGIGMTSPGSGSAWPSGSIDNATSFGRASSDSDDGGTASGVSSRRTW